MSAPEDFERHLLAARAPLLAFVRRRVGDDATAEDVVQETLLRALRSAPRLGDGEPLAPWLFEVARNAVTDLHRRRSAARRGAERYAVEREAEAEALTPEDERALCACVLALVPTLTPELAAVVEADLAGKAPEALAAELGITRNLLKVRRHRARRQLRDRLEATCRVCATHGCLDCTCRKPVG